MAKPSPKRRAASKAAPPLAIEPPRFVAPVPDRVEPLAFPVTYAGQVYSSITLRRPSSGVLGRWFEQFADGADAGAELHANVPIFVDDAGELVPDAVLSALDDDDRQKVFADADPFFPRRLALALELLTQGSPPSPGEPAAQTSSA